jgi:glutamate 5-kinase
VSTEEIEFGDNDSLSAKIALMMSAEKLILLTDVDGLFESDPKKYPNAQLIEFKSRVTAKDLAAHKLSAKSARGTGGIYSKLLAAQAAQKAKIETHLVRGDARNFLLEIAEAKSIGTLFGVTK